MTTVEDEYLNGVTVGYEFDGSEIEDPYASVALGLTDQRLVVTVSRDGIPRRESWGDREAWGDARITYIGLERRLGDDVERVPLALVLPAKPLALLPWAHDAFVEFWAEQLEGSEAAMESRAESIAWDRGLGL